MVTSAREIVQLGLQTSVGEVAATFRIPIEPGSFTTRPMFEQILDRGRRGVEAMDFRAVQGVGISELSWDGLVRQGSDDLKSEVGFLLANILGDGSPVTPTQIAATGNYDHRLLLGTSKTYFTIEHSVLGSGNDRVFVDARVTELRLTFNRAEGTLNYSVTLTAQAPTATTITSSLSDKALDPHRGFEPVADIGGNADISRLISADVTFRRDAMPFYGGSNAQTYTDLYFGPLEVTAGLVFNYQINTDYNLFLNKTQGELSLNFNVGAGQGSEDATTRRFAIAGLADFGDGPAEVSTSEVNARLTVAARFLYRTGAGYLSTTGNSATSAMNSPIEVQIVQPETASYASV